MNPKPRILVVDDDMKFVKIMKKVLTLKGFDVQIVLSGVFALAALRASDFDLVITDINMPGMDGIELIKRIREFKPVQRVIVITGFPTLSTAQQVFKLGTLNYVAKPFTSKHLFEIINTALAKPQQNLLGAVQLALKELIQLYALGRRTAVLKVYHNHDVGRIYFKEGQIIHVETADQKGEEAFFEIQSWKDGGFTTESCDSKITRSIKRSVESLLVEGARRQNEYPDDGLYQDAPARK